MSFDLADYVDVPARIRAFKEKHPDGFLTGHGDFVRNAAGEIVGYLYTACAHTSLDGAVAVGTAYEPIPGKTPYTRDSEPMNAETSAWGRAIAALGFDFGSVASREEVRNRSGASGGGGAAAPAANGAVKMPFGKHKGKTVEEIAAVDIDYIRWLASPSFEPNAPAGAAVKQQATALLNDAADSIPF